MNIIFIILLTLNLNACNTHVQSSLIKRETIYWSKEYIVDQIFNNYDNYELQPDSNWYSDQSDEVLKGNFNLLGPLFITSPFFILH